MGIALAPVNNDVQAPQIANAYLDDTEPVVEEKKKFELAFNTAKEGGLKHMQAEPVATFYIAKTEEVVDAEKADAAVEVAPAIEVAAVKSAAVPKAEPDVGPVVYTVPQLYGYPAYTYPMLPMKYVLLPVTAPLAATSAVEEPANVGSVVEEA